MLVASRTGINYSDLRKNTKETATKLRWRTSLNYKLVAYIPELALTSTKTALFSAGAGHQGNYDSCSWQVLGEGQFRPLKGSNPSIGRQGEVETVSEWRLEVLVPKEALNDVIRALKEVHPYEEPAYEVYECIDIGKS